MKPQTNSNLRMGMTLMLMIFFIFGFITNFNIALKDQVQATFHLSSFMANLVNGVFFFAYFVFSFICGRIIKKTGYKMGVIIGLLLIGLGSFLFYPAVAVPSYALFLCAVFCDGNRSGFFFRLLQTLMLLHWVRKKLLHQGLIWHRH